MQMTKKITSIVLALLMVVSLFVAVPATANAAPTESLLITINSEGHGTSEGDEFVSGSRTFNNIATVTFSSDVENDDDNDGWYYSGWSNKILSVAPAAGYTITKVKFYCKSGSAFDETSPFEATLYASEMYVNGSKCGRCGVTKIEVYGYATPAHTEHTYTANPTFNWSQDASTGDWNCDKLTLTCSDCDATQDYEVAGFFGASAVTCTANTDGSFTYSVSKTVDGTKYEDSKTYDANSVVKSAKQLTAAAKKGGSWKLGADIDGAHNVVCANGFVLDGKNYTVTRSTSVDTNPVFRITANPAEVTLKNLTIDGLDGRSNSKPAVATKMSNPSAGNVLNLENVTITNYDFDEANNGVVLAWGQATVNMKNCTVDTDSNYDVWGGAASTINVDGGKVGGLYLNGGTASAELTNGAVVDNFATSSDNKIKDNGDGTYSVVPKVYVAQDVATGTKYETVNEAVAAAGEGGEVKLIADITGNVGIDGDYTTTLDLNGYTITNTAGSGITLYSKYPGGKTFTIKDTSAAQTGAITITKKYPGDGCISDSSGRKVVIEGGTYTSNDKALYISSDEGWTINGGTFNGKVHVLSDVDITDGTFNGEIVQSGKPDYSTPYPWTETPADIEISGGTFANPVPEEFCADGFIPKDNGDGTYGVKVPNYIAQVGENKYETLDPAVADAISTSNDIYLLAACNKAPNNVFSKLDITGADPVMFKVHGNGFYGASFAAKTDIANGAYVNTWTISGTGKNAVYTYTIKPATVMVTRANGDVIYPTSLANALNGMDSVCAKEGDTVTLLSNLTWDSAKVAIPVKYSGVTLDLNGNTLTGEKENFLQVKNDNTLTIENGTIVNTAADIVVGEGSTLNLDGATVGNINAGAGAEITFDNVAGITGDVDVPAGYKVVTDATTGKKTVVAMNLQDLADEGFGTTKTAGLGFVDTNRENIVIPAKASILGVQLRKQPQNGYYEYGGISNALRFITAVDEEFLANTDIKDYGYLITINNITRFQTCKNTTNNVIKSGDSQEDGISYFTAAIYNIPDGNTTNIKVQFVFKTAQDNANDSSDDLANIGAYAVYKPDDPATKYELNTNYKDVYDYFNP